MKRFLRYRDIEDLHRTHAARAQNIRLRLSEFAVVQPREYFYELAYCLLTPQSSAVNAGAAIERLREAGFPESDLDPAEILNSRTQYVRFHNTKARRLREAKQQLPDILAALQSGISSAETRMWLVRNVNGLGWKESSHFLRNIGHRDLAILDRHILKNLKRHGVIRAVPRTLTPARYAAIEQKFLRFAEALGIPMDELDLLFWSRETGEILK